MTKGQARGALRKAQTRITKIKRAMKPLHGVDPAAWPDEERARYEKNTARCRLYQGILIGKASAA